MSYDICVVGHRPDKLGGRWDPNRWKSAIPVVKEYLTGIGSRAKDELLVYNGLTPGFDLIAAAAILQLRSEGMPIKLFAVLPHPADYDDWHNDLARKWHERAIAQADQKIVLHDKEPISEDGKRSIFKNINWLRERNFFMIDRSREVLACCDKEFLSRTYTSVEYARTKGVPVVNVYHDIKQVMRF